MSTIEQLTSADHAAVGCLLLEAYADYGERIGPDAWMRLRDGLAQAAGSLRDAEIAARGLYERMGFVVDGDLPMNFGLRYGRFRRSLGGG